MISVDATSTERRTRAYLDAIADDMVAYLRFVQDTARQARRRACPRWRPHGPLTSDSSKIFMIPNGSWVICTGPTASWTGPTRRPSTSPAALADMVAYNGGRPLTCHA